MVHFYLLNENLDRSETAADAPDVVQSNNAMFQTEEDLALLKSRTKTDNVALGQENQPPKLRRNGDMQNVKILKIDLRSFLRLDGSFEAVQKLWRDTIISYGSG